jgi:hypothetical protein
MGGLLQAMAAEVGDRVMTGKVCKATLPPTYQV